MADAALGRQLIAAGWDQGVLLPVLCWSIVFDRGDPVTPIARAAMKSGGTGHSWDIPAAAQGLPPHAVASGLLRGSDRLVVASQACDIDKSPEFEPAIIAMRAFLTDNERTLRAAASNSARHFLLDPARGIVIDATVVTIIEKPLLAALTPEPGAPDTGTRRRFTRWLARRYNRPAHPDDVVTAVVAPILNNLRSLQQGGDPVIDVLDEVEEVRFAPPAGPLPYAVRLLFVLPDSERAAEEARITALARLVRRMLDWFDPARAIFAAWDALPLAEISASDYLDTDELLLEEYTYRGLTVRGLEPRQYR